MNRPAAAAVLVDALESRLALSVAPAPFALGPNTTPIAATTDVKGNLIVVGSYSGTVDFNPRRHQTGALDSAADGPLYLAKYSPDGNLFWATPFGHSADMLSGPGPEITGISTDPGDNILLVGRLTGAYDFDPGRRRRVLDTAAIDGDAADQDAFVWKFRPDGSYGYATLLHVPGFGQFGDSLKVNATGPDGSAYVIGRDVGVPYAVPAFLAKLSPDGALAWANPLDDVDPTDVALDPNQNPVVLTRADLRGIAVTRFTAAGKFTGRARLAVSSTYDSLYPAGLEIDAAGNLFVTGTLSGSADFDPDPGASLLRDSAPPAMENGPKWSGFLAKYTPDHRPLFVNVLGGRATAGGLALDRTTGEVVIAGSFERSVDLDTAANTSFLVDTGDTYPLDGGRSDLFVARYDARGRFVSARHLGVAKAQDQFVGFGLTPGHRPAIVASVSHTEAPRDRFTGVFRV